MQCNVQALTKAIAAAVSKAVKEAMTSQQQPDHNSTAHRQVGQIVDGETASIAQGIQGEPTNFVGEQWRMSPADIYQHRYNSRGTS